MSQVQLNQYISAKGGNEKLADVAGDADKAFNDYAFIWEPKRLRYFVNGKMVHEVTDPAKIPRSHRKSSSAFGNRHAERLDGTICL